MNDVAVHDENFGTWWFRLENSILKLLLDESAPILKKYVGIASATRRYFHVKPDSPVEDFVAEAPGHPVFRLMA